LSRPICLFAIPRTACCSFRACGWRWIIAHDRNSSRPG
jgi:hypothetical protein